MSIPLAFATITAIGAALAGVHILLNHLFPHRRPEFTCDTGGCDQPAQHVGQRHTGDLRWYCNDCWDELNAANALMSGNPLPGGWGDPDAINDFNRQEPPL